MNKFFTGLAIATIAYSASFLNANAASDDVKYTLKVDGMFCQSCAARSKNAMMKLKGVKNVDVNVAKGKVFVCAASDASLADPELKEVFLSKGLSYKGKSASGKC